MSVKLCSLASGSSGNSTFVINNNTGLLIDAGISYKSIFHSLKSIDICASKIKALLITHEHSDHIKCAGVVSRKLNIPIYANEKTWDAMSSSLGKVNIDNIRIFETGTEFEIEDIKIKSFNIPHDAIEPVGFTLQTENVKIGVATDLGEFTEEVKENLEGSNFVLLESNHDVEMLRAGSYPYFLKRRILSEHGHLSNPAAGHAACELVDSGISDIMLGHLSKENNFPELAYETVKGIMREKEIKIGWDVNLNLAPRNNVSRLFIWD
ncbi:MAG: MBL fold metallo-hydrolase [Firmicutes bacterium]|nr:MBL fold metallo-hydrolase [Bacillota bacterium]